MPHQALVAFGVVYGFVLLSWPVPAWCSELNTADQASNRTINAAPKTITKQRSESATNLPTLTLDDVLTRALTHSPTLLAFSQEIKAREFAGRQAGLRPNPEFSLEVGDIAGSGDFSGTARAESALRISQRIELGGKRTRRQALGRLELELAERNYVLAQSALRSLARERFIAVLAAQKRQALATEHLALTQKVLYTVANRIAAGKTAEIERIRFQSLTVEARLRQERAARELTAALRSLATTWGSEAIDFATVTGQLELIQEVPDWSELTERLTKSAAVAKQKDLVRHAERSLALEQARRIPDLTFSLGAKNERESGANALLVELSLPLQLFDRNQHAIAAARARKAKAENAARSTQLSLRAELAEDWKQLHAAQREATVLREEILPAAEKIFAAVSYGYQSGKFGFLEVLDAERTLFESKDRYVAALSAYHRAVAELEQLLGAKIFAGVLTNKTLSTLAVDKRGQS